jgi:hypothetical protein
MRGIDAVGHTRLVRHDDLRVRLTPRSVATYDFDTAGASAGAASTMPITSAHRHAVERAASAAVHVERP